MMWLRRLYWRIRKWLVNTSVNLQLKVVKGDYPANSRFIQDEPRHTKKTIVVEVMPGRRMLALDGGLVICLYFPYTYFVIRYMEYISPLGKFYVASGMMIGFNANRIDSSNGNVGKLPLSNYARSYSFCLGTGSASIGPYDSVRELVEAHINSFWKSAFQMNPIDCERWALATKLGDGEHYVESLIVHESPIHQLMEVSSNEQFFDYQSKPERPSGNRPNRRKKRKGSRRKA